MWVGVGVGKGDTMKLMGMEIEGTRTEQALDGMTIVLLYGFAVQAALLALILWRVW